MTAPLTLALSKGRILEQSLSLLAKTGVYPLEDPATSRKLILETNRPEIKLVPLRATVVSLNCCDATHSGAAVQG